MTVPAVPTSVTPAPFKTWAEAVTTDVNALENATSSVWIPASEWLAASAGSALGSTLGTAGNRVPAWQLDADATEEAIYGVWDIPGWSAAHVDMVWGNAGAGSGNIRFRTSHNQLSDGSALGGATETVVDATIAAPAQNIVKVTRLLTSLAITGDFLRLELTRLGSHVDDTLGNDMGVLGVKLLRA